MYLEESSFHENVRLKLPNQSKKNEYWAIIRPFARELSQPAFWELGPEKPTVHCDEISPTAGVTRQMNTENPTSLEVNKQRNAPRALRY
jgi:hypothetical protein